MLEVMKIATDTLIQRGGTMQTEFPTHPSAVTRNTI